MIKVIFNKETNEVIVNISGEVGRGWFSDGVTLDSIMEQVKNSGAQTIVLNVNSMGGDLMEGLGIHDYLKLTNKKVISNIIGSTASAGTIIALAADETYIAPNARYLIHQASTMADGNADDLQKQADTLKSYDNTITDLYCKKTGKDKEFISGLMKENRWLSAQEAIEYGFCDNILTKINNNSKTKIMDEEQIKMIQAENEALKAKVAELTSKLAEYETKEVEAEAEAIDNEIQAAIDAEKITDAEKEVYQNFGKGNLAGLKAKLKALEPKKKVFNWQPKPVEKEENLTWDHLYRNEPAKLQNLKVNDFKLFNQIFKTKFGTDYKRKD